MNAGAVHCRATVNLAGVADDEFTLVLPGSSDECALEAHTATLNGQSMAPEPSPEENAYRWYVPAAMLRGPLEVQLDYVVRGQKATGLVGMTRLMAPRPDGDGIVEGLAWQLEDDSGRIVVPLSPMARLENPWTWHGWLQPPVPSSVANRPVFNLFGEEASGRLTLLTISKQAALLLGSLLAFILATLVLAQRWWLRWLGLGTGFVLALCLLFLAPQAMALVFYAAQPGLLLIALTWTIQQAPGWLRRTDPVPARAFSRTLGSSVSRATSSPPRPSSTAEAEPRPAGS